MPQTPKFESTTENELLKEEVRREIKREGRITFRRFMEVALYHPQHGYYNSQREKLGRQGDYLTSPEVHPVFGQMVGGQLREMWARMGSPPRFDVLEMGAGTGVLCRDILRWAQRGAPEFVAALRYRLNDRSDEMRRRQRRTVAELGEIAPAIVTWEEAPEPEQASVEGCILSNELVDSFPVHRVEMRGGKLLEVYVGWRDKGFYESLGELSTPELAGYFETLGVRPGEGCKAEVNLEAIAWMRTAANALARGFVFTFDYGYAAEKLYAPWRRDGTLLCSYRHSLSGDPYARIGRQDMTAHVDFTTLIREGERAGLSCIGLTTQERFLSAMGIGGLLAAPENASHLEEYYARRRAAGELTDPTGLGRVKVLVQEKRVGEAALPWLTGLQAVS